MTEIAILLFFLLVSVGGGLLLWKAVDAEKHQRRTMDRESAERAARRDTEERATARESAERAAERDTDERTTWRDTAEGRAGRDEDDDERRGF
ncbi:hypothetical protein [Halorussus salinus]|uniref:hypothetical protein n=1 Tax=Halorussus salinus TaxID=1364935 RepID=UPI001091CED8|nr:hypothetical protein [Halorussus salinus]